MKIKAKLILVFAALAVAGMVACRDSKSAVNKKSAAVPVTVATAVAKDTPVQLTAIGAVKAYSTVSVKSQQKGELVHVGFKEGDEVRQGALIFAIDARPFEGALKQAQAHLDRDRAMAVRAEADFKRAEELLKGNSITEAAYDQSRAALDALKATIAAAEAALQGAKVQLEFCQMRAPITGRVGMLLVNQGNIVRDVDAVLAVINQIKPICVDFSVPEQSLSEVRQAAAAGKVQVAVTLQQQERVATGELAVINNEVDKATGTILLRAVFANTDEMLWPGQFVSVVLTLRVEKDAVVVPTQAINFGQKGEFVFVVKDDSTVEMRPVTTGIRRTDEVVIVRGVVAGERLVTSGQLRLVPGSKIEIKSEDNADKK